jgi:hypothetical protein
VFCFFATYIVQLIAEAKSNRSPFVIIAFCLGIVFVLVGEAIAEQSPRVIIAFNSIIIVFAVYKFHHIKRIPLSFPSSTEDFIPCISVV